MSVLLLFPFLFLLFCTSESESFKSYSPDAMSLLAIKSNITFAKHLNWISTTSYCTWYGVSCHEFSARVVSLNITETNISGTLSSAVGDLSHLRVLSLSNNAMFGEIPVEIGKLKFLQTLELQGNNFSGTIPHQISMISSLQLLNLSSNSFSGPIPDKLIGFGRIRVIDLSYNQLGGGIRIDGYSECESLLHLRLSWNFLVGSIPPQIGNCSNLRSFLVDGNILEYKIPGEIGGIRELRVLDVSRNSLTGRVPKELGKCRKLAVVVLTNLDGFDSADEGGRGEFNAFEGRIPWQVLLIPELEVVWAPRANLGGKLRNKWRRDSCRLRVVNLGQNYLTGSIPETMGLCRNLTFLDLSSNVLRGSLPSELQVSCMVYFNVSHNSLSSQLPGFGKSNCSNNFISYSQESSFLEKVNIEDAYFSVPLLGSRISRLLDGDFIVVHDFSWNNFSGALPLFSFGNGFSSISWKASYNLLLNNNQFNGSLPGEFFSAFSNLYSIAVNLSVNEITGVIPQGLLLNCSQLTHFEAAHNQLVGSIPTSIGGSQKLQFLDLGGNRLNGSLPYQLGELKNVKCILLGGNSLTGEIPSELGHLVSLTVLDLSRNALTGTIPANLVNATNLDVLLLNNNNFSGEIPLSFSTLASLIKLDVSFNNLSGYIPHFQHVSDCDSFKGNHFVRPCPDPNSVPPTGLPVPLEVHKRRSKLKLIVITLVTSVSVVVLVLLVMFLVMVCRRRKLNRVGSIRRKILVTFSEVPAEVHYDNVVRATGNFSVGYLIGTGGFGATYKAELVPGFLVAVKRLSIGKFQGIQQFEAEIRTLGRIRHKNLVTLIGYYMGEVEMLLIYNYLSGGNLETFLHDRSSENVRWPVIHKIALDIAQALAYLHYSCDPRIVHRDIKPSNILLDEDLNAYLSDFGLARLLEVSESHATTDVAGTFGYVAPEYATTCRVSDKADVYSFGVVLLELMSGKKSLDPSFSHFGNGFNIVAWAKLLIKDGRSSMFFPPELWETGPQENLLRMLRLAEDCTGESLSDRPSMKEVADKLKQLRTPET